MAWNGSGTFSRKVTTVSPAVGGTTIDVADQNSYTADVTAGIDACLAKNGENAATGDLDLGSKKLTNVADGTLVTDAPNVGQIQDGSFVYEGTVGGTTDLITLTLSPTLTEYVDGMVVRFRAGATNTTTAALNIDGLGARTLVTHQISALQAGDISVDGIYEAVYSSDGTRFILQNAARSPHSAYVSNADGTPNVDDTGNTITTTVASGVIESIGPTGAGADNTWTALDNAPLGVSWVELKIYADISFTTSTSITVTVYGKAADSGETFDSFADALLHHKITDAENAAKTLQVFGIAKVPVDATNSFDIRWDTAGSPDSESIIIYLSGYGWN